MSLAETRREQIFPVLDAAQLENARRFTDAAPREFAAGETIFSVGERHAPAWLILKGEIEIFRRDGLNREAMITAMGAGRAGRAERKSLPQTACDISDHRRNKEKEKKVLIIL